MNLMTKKIPSLSTLVPGEGRTGKQAWHLLQDGPILDHPEEGEFFLETHIEFGSIVSRDL